MRTIIEADIFPVCGCLGAINLSDFMTTTTRNISFERSRLNSNNSEEESISNDFIFIPSSPSSLSNTNSHEVIEQNLSEQEYDIDYLTEFICPSDSDIGDDDDNDLYLETHLNRQQLIISDNLQDKIYQRSKRSNKKMNAQRQIKCKQAKSIKNKSHNKHLYIHHRLAKKVILDEPSYHCIPSSQPIPLYSIEALRSIVYQHRHPYNSSYVFYSIPSKKARQSKISNETYIDESQINLATYQYREYTLNEYNIPDEPSYDDAMINFLLDMQNRDLSPEDYEMLLRLDERVQRKTINTNILDTLPSINADQAHLDERCSICMEKYNLDQQLKLLPCTHIFHSNCIETYLKEFSVQCPLDNLPII